MLFILGLFTLVHFNPASAQTLDKFFSKIKPGEWVEFEGRAQPDMSILVKEIEIVKGEMEEDDWEITGTIRKVIPSEKKIYILNLPIVFDENTEYEDDYDIIKSFSDIKKGMRVELEGQYLKEGIFLASEIGSEEKKKDEINVVEWVGKIESVDVKNKMITIMGHTLILTPDTKIKSFIY